jgi:superkiller protein 3
MMRNKSFFTALLLLGAASFPGNAMGDNIQDHVFSGNKFVQDKKYHEAVREYETAVRLDPKNANANLLLGLTLANTGDLDRAAQYSTAAVALEPSYSGYYNLGLIYANQEKYDLAIEAYEKAVKLNPNSYQAWYQMGLVYSTALKFDKAVEAYEKAVQLNPKFASAYQGLGSAYYWNSDTPAAYKQAAKLKELKLAAKAQELESWIQDKESKKKKSEQKA